MPSTNLQTIWKRCAGVWMKPACQQRVVGREAEQLIWMPIVFGRESLFHFVLHNTLAHFCRNSAVKFDHPCYYMVVSRVEGVRAGTLSRGRIWLKWRVDLGAGRVGAAQYNAHRVLVWWIWGCVVYPEVLWWPFGKSLSIANLIPSVLFSVSLSTNT